MNLKALSIASLVGMSAQAGLAHPDEVIFSCDNLKSSHAVRLNKKTLSMKITAKDADEKITERRQGFASYYSSGKTEYYTLSGPFYISPYSDSVSAPSELGIALFATLKIQNDGSQAELLSGKTGQSGSLALSCKKFED